MIGLKDWKSLIYEKNEKFLLHCFENKNDPSVYPVTIVVGVPMLYADACAGQFPALLRCLRRRQIYSKSAIFRVNDTHPIEDRQNDTIWDMLSDYVASDQQEVFLTTLKALLNGWQNQNSTQFFLQQQLRRITHILLQVAAKHGIYDLETKIDELLSRYHDYPSLWDGLHQMITSVWKDSATGQNASISDAVQTIADYIERHYMEQFSISGLAMAAGYTPEHLSRQFKKVYHNSPMEHLTETRIHKACAILESSPFLKLSQVSLLVGYKNQLYFSRIFKGITGMSPTDYKAGLVRKAECKI